MSKTIVRIEQNHLSAAPSACDFHKVYLRSVRCWRQTGRQTILFNIWKNQILYQGEEN